jgi:thiopeptide-type bacteriocin biosynthesis protein
LEYIENSEEQSLKWLYGLKIIDSLLSDFNFNLENKMLFMESLANSFRQEMNLDKSSAKKINIKYMSYKTLIDRFFTFFSTEYSFLDNLIVTKSNAIKESAEFILSNEYSHSNEIIASHIHMSMNRLFTAHNRQTEYMSYEMLARYYKSVNARMKYDPNYVS